MSTWNEFYDNTLLKKAPFGLVNKISYIQRKIFSFSKKESLIEIYYSEKNKSWICRYKVEKQTIFGQVEIEFSESGDILLRYFLKDEDQMIEIDEVASFDKLNVENFILLVQMIDFFSELRPLIKVNPSLITIEHSDNEDPISSIEWYSPNISLVIAFYLKNEAICFSYIAGNDSGCGDISSENYKEIINKINSLLNKF